MQVNTVEKLASVGAFGLWAALHGWLGWLAVLYAICMLLDCVTGTALAVKEKTWNSSKARKGLWHKGGSTIMICVSVLTDIFLGLVINHVLGLQLPFDYDYVVDARRFDLVHCHGAGQHSGKRRRDGRARPTGFKGSAGESTQGI